jgi:hypothetical protein
MGLQAAGALPAGQSCRGRLRPGSLGPSRTPEDDRGCLGEAARTGEDGQDEEGAEDQAVGQGEPVGNVLEQHEGGGPDHGPEEPPGPADDRGDHQLGREHPVELLGRDLTGPILTEVGTDIYTRSAPCPLAPRRAGGRGRPGRAA